MAAGGASETDRCRRHNLLSYPKAWDELKHQELNKFLIQPFLLNTPRHLWQSRERRKETPPTCLSDLLQTDVWWNKRTFLSHYTANLMTLKKGVKIVTATFKIFFLSAEFINAAAVKTTQTCAGAKMDSKYRLCLQGLFFPCCQSKV